MHWDTFKQDNYSTVRGDGEVRSARYEPALVPPCPSIKVLSYSNCQRSSHSMSKWMLKNFSTLRINIYASFVQGLLSLHHLVMPDAWKYSCLWKYLLCLVMQQHVLPLSYNLSSNHLMVQTSLCMLCYAIPLNKISIKNERVNVKTPR